MKRYWTRALVAFLATVCTVAVIFIWVSGDAGPPTRHRPDPRFEGASLVHFESGTHVRGSSVRTVLRSRHDVTAFSGWFPRLDVESDLAGRDFRTEALIAFMWSTACTKGDSAVLTYAEPTGFSVRLTDTTTSQTCTEPYSAIAVFAVPRDEAPEDVRIGGTSPGPPGPAEQIAFAPLREAARPRGAEVSQPDQLRDFLDGLPEERKGSRPELEDLPESGAGQRLFAYVVQGCRHTGAVLRITEKRMVPEPVGGEGVRCVAPESFVAVFRVPAQQVPPSAAVG
ncbi:hypothetical protein AB0B50_23910 [Streptomyces sp. NPDC041068]|uniref:hypothetical protein n=1 Tax=Streptomyces sp. NPDC041068 TaxID=3155130 RepID=UPI0034056C3A